MDLALIYNTDIRNNGTARRVFETLCRMGDKPTRYSRPADRVGKHDWFLFVDDGRDDIDWFPEGRKACWLIDTHLGWNTRLEWAKKFDRVFVAQREAVKQLEDAGVGGAEWLPLACSPQLDPSYKELAMFGNREWDLTRRYDCCFVGYMNRGVANDPTSYDRVAVLDALFKAFPNSWLTTGVFFEEAAIRYVRARVGLNVSIKRDLNMRFFECLSYGVCQVCNRTMDGWKALGFEDKKHFLGWDTVEEATELIRWALEHPAEREAIAEEGYRLVRAEHTYRHRVEQILRRLAE